MNAPKSRQILLVTDGRSNDGCSPTEAAAFAYRRKIIVNVIGIGGRRPLSRRAVAEIEGIARAGGGYNKFVQHDFVQHDRLTNILDNVTQLPVLKVGSPFTVRRQSSYYKTFESALDVLILVDTSASMMKKLDAIRVALYQFAQLMRGRHLNSRIAVYTFPAENSVTSIVSRQPWTSHVEYLPSLMTNIRMRGITPTGTAIISAVREFDALGDN